MDCATETAWQSLERDTSIPTLSAVARECGWSGTKDLQATAARMSQETVAAQDMLIRFTQWQGRQPESVAADTTYGNGSVVAVKCGTSC